MTVSMQESYGWHCKRCDGDRTAPVWRIVDARERGDALNTTGPGLSWVDCPGCGTRAPVELPQLIIRPGSSVPLLVAAPLVELRGGRAQQHSIDLMDEARNAGAFSAVTMLDVPNLLPCSLLPIVLSRDIDRDAGDREFAREQLAAHSAETAAHYEVFLNSLAWHREARIRALILSE